MDWLIALLQKLETPALIVSGVCIAILYRLLTERDKSIDNLADKIHSLAELISSHNAIVSLCCMNNNKKDGA